MSKILFFIFSYIFLITGAYSQVAVIANKSVPLTKISKSQLLDYYTGDIRFWSNENPIVVFDMKSKGDVKNTFYKFLGKTTSRMKSLWLKRMLSGEGDPPEAVKTEEEMLEKVATTPGAIGFISKAKANNKVKTLTIIEKNKK